MIGPNAQHSYYLYDGSADVRKRFDGLCGLVRNCKLPKKGEPTNNIEDLLLHNRKPEGSFLDLGKM